MDKLKLIHHSLADWEFEPNHRYYITADYSISSPSSLATPTPAGANYYYYCYLKYELAHNVPNGRFIAYFRQQEAWLLFRIFFRQQTPLHHLGNQNGYVLIYAPGDPGVQIFRYIAAVQTYIGHINVPLYDRNTWRKLKFDFYQYITGAPMTTLRIEIFQEIAGAWVSQGYVEDGVNAFANSPENRIGFALWGPDPPYPSLIDDIEIWKQA